jgi:N-acetylmuramoyl-L-alanine amidase
MPRYNVKNSNRRRRRSIILKPFSQGELMFRQIFSVSLVAIMLMIYLPIEAEAQTLISPNRIISCQTNLEQGNISFATSLASPVAAPVIYYRQGANGGTLMFADFPYVTYPFAHQILTIGNDNVNSADPYSQTPLPSENYHRQNGQIDKVGFEQLHTTPPIFRITIEARNREALKNISFQADYGRLTITWPREPKPIAGESSQPIVTQAPEKSSPDKRHNHLEEAILAPAAAHPSPSTTCHLLFTTASLTISKNLAGLTVVLDPGHGGSDPGAQREGIQEKEITLAIVNILKKFLEDRGIKVLLTRSDDNFVSLEDRVKIANTIEPDLFLSVHINALQNDPDVHGVETYYKTPQSRELAESIHDSLVGYLGIPDRLVRKARFYVINHTDVPAVLAEVGFISSQEERQRLISSDYQDRVATALEHGVILYLAKAKELAQKSESSENLSELSEPKRRAE